MSTTELTIVPTSNNGAIPDVPTMSSREIAELTEKAHANVCRDIRNMLEGLGVLEIKFESEYSVPTGNGGTRRAREFLLPKRETLILVSGYSVQLRARIIDRWQELETEATAPVFVIPQTLPDALRLAADLADKNRELEATVTAQTPKVRALDRLATAQGSLCLRDAAKVLQVRPLDLARYLRDHCWIFTQAEKEWRAYQKHITGGLLEQKEFTVWGSAVDKVRVQVRVTQKGLTRLAEQFETEGAA